LAAKFAIAGGVSKSAIELSKPPVIQVSTGGGVGALRAKMMAAKSGESAASGEEGGASLGTKAASMLNLGERPKSTGKERITKISTTTTNYKRQTTNYKRQTTNNQKNYKKINKK
jgi:hypothetical protein